jgi:hypothetical protein
MREITRICRDLAPLVAVVVCATAGCGGNSSGPAAGSDGGLADTAPDEDALWDGSSDGGSRIVAGWLARDFAAAPPGSGALPRSIGEIATENASGDAPDGRLIFLLHVEDMSGGQAGFTYGLGEVVDPAVPGQYRFRADAPPTRLVGMLSGNYFVAEHVTAPLTIPIAPGGASSPFTFVVEPKPGSDYTFQFELTPTSPHIGIFDAWLSRGTACLGWIDGMNLLDVLDGTPTLGLNGSVTGSVYWDTCDSWGPNEPPYSLGVVEIYPFEAVQLVLSDG